MESRYKKIVIWGTGVDYNQHLINFKYLEEIGEILVLGVTGNDKYYINLDGYQFIPKAELTNIVDFDYIVVASKKYNG